MRSQKLAWALLLGICVAFTWGLISLYELRFVAGDIYPAYSSLRSDPLGAEALFDSTAQLPGYSARRNFQELENLHDRNVTILCLGEDPFSFALAQEDDLKRLAETASRGVRLVFALRPVKHKPASENMAVKGAALERRWGITFDYIPRLAIEAQSDTDDQERLLPKKTALVMKEGGHASPVIEKQFGAGSVVLIGNAYPFSNEALATERDANLLARAIGPFRTILFDEHHLGLSEDASVVMLARKYRLTGLAGGLLLLAALLIWRNSASLLPRRRQPPASEARLASDRGSASALHHLLRRNIAETDLVPTCVAEWEKSRQEARGCTPEKLSIIRQLASTPGKGRATELYRTLQSIITQRD
jgi:hypothetical protein